jgi:hypothetical protein
MHHPIDPGDIHSWARFEMKVSEGDQLGCPGIYHNEPGSFLYGIEYSGTDLGMLEGGIGTSN